MPKTYVYYNLHKHCLSLMENGKVMAHATKALLRGIEFRVRESGRQRVIKEKKKNVHAFVIGTGAHSATIAELDYLTAAGHFDKLLVGYNPYKGAAFVNKGTGTPVYTADWAFIDGKEIIAYIARGR